MENKFASFRHTAFRLVAGASRSIPFRFSVTRILGPDSALRSLVFHDVSNRETPFTKGMGVNITPREFEAMLEVLVRHYDPVSLSDVLAGSRKLVGRPVLVTFDDGYGSLVHSAVPACRRMGVPAVFFLNAHFIDNVQLAPDNLVCFMANEFGMEMINAAARTINPSGLPCVNVMSDVFRRLFPALSPTRRGQFLEKLVLLSGIDEKRLARESKLYMTGAQVRDLANAGFEIGSHTYSHFHCRTLSPLDFEMQIDANKSALEALSGTKVRSFSIPYGSSADLTHELLRHLRRTGHDAVFLSQSVANARNANPLRLDRVSPSGGQEDSVFLELEILPRLRAMRNRLKPRTDADRRPAQNEHRPGFGF